MFDEGVIITVKVFPKARQNKVMSWENEELKVQITAAPEQGKANDALIALLAKEFKLSKSQIIILQGEKSKKKRVLLKSVTEDVLQNYLSQI